jgi:hypothetical protein
VEFLALGGSVNLPTTATNLGSVTVSCPSNGFIAVSLSGDAVFFGDSTVMDIGLGTAIAALDLATQRTGRQDGTGTNRYVQAFNVNAVVPCTAGDKQLFATAQKESVFATNSINLGDLFLQAQFFPKRY